MSGIRHVGLDVHGETIAIAVAEPGGEVRTIGVIPNRSEAVERAMRKLGPFTHLRACYEAGPTGYVLYWQLTQLGIHCDVIAPTLVPVRAGDRVKTDRRDAAKLARCYRGGDLTPVWVPDEAHEALRDLVRARLAARRDQTRARHRLSKFLLRHGRRPSTTMTPWTVKHVEWIRTVRFKHAAQQTTLGDYLHEVDHQLARIVRLDAAITEAIDRAPEAMRQVVAGLKTLRGIATVAAVSLVAELGELSRFDHPRQLMSYAGVVSREHSSGDRVHRGAISKAGNAHVRRLIIEAAWSYRHRPSLGHKIRKRQAETTSEVRAIAWNAQHRLHRRYCALLERGKCKPKIITALGRELLGFVWAIGVSIERGATGAPAIAA